MRFIFLTRVASSILLALALAAAAGCGLLTSRGAKPPGSAPSPVWPCSFSHGGEPQLFRSDWKFLHAVFEQPGIAVWLGNSVFRQHSPFDRQLLHADHGADRYQR